VWFACSGCDDIIRQHKAACLRVTSLLACKDLLWIGTSAGVILTMPLPHIAPATTKLSSVPSATGNNILLHVYWLDKASELVIGSVEHLHLIPTCTYEALSNSCNLQFTVARAHTHAHTESSQSVFRRHCLVRVLDSAHFCSLRYWLATASYTYTHGPRCLLLVSLSVHCCAGLCQHSHFGLHSHLDPWSRFLFSHRHVYVQKLGLFFDERKYL
jgi:hypothetical protein